MDTKRRGRSRALMRLVGIAVLTGAALSPAFPATPASAADTRTWVIDADTLTTANIQEDGIFSDGDEPYIAVVGYRSRFGVPGSTNAVFVGGLHELSGGADDGDVLTIPDAMGRVNFPTVTRCSLADMTEGCSPEVIGTITVAMESDATPWSSMNSMFHELAAVARQEIAGVVESTPLSITSLSELGDRFKTAIANIEDGTRRTFWENLGLWLSSWSDPDDKIAFQFTAFVTVDDALAPTVDAAVASVLPADRGFGGALQPRGFTLSFSGDGATYRAAYNVS